MCIRDRNNSNSNLPLSNEKVLEINEEFSEVFHNEDLVSFQIQINDGASSCHLTIKDIELAIRSTKSNAAGHDQIPESIFRKYISFLIMPLKLFLMHRLNKISSLLIGNMLMSFLHLKISRTIALFPYCHLFLRCLKKLFFSLLSCLSLILISSKINSLLFQTTTLGQQMHLQFCV